jgi:hypothetical protein
MSTYVTTGCCGYGAIATPGVSVSGSSTSGLIKLAEFEVGAAGAPMADGDVSFFHPSLATATGILVLTNAGPLPTIPISGGRYVTLDTGTSTIIFTGGVVAGEVIAIFKY